MLKILMKLITKLECKLINQFEKSMPSFSAAKDKLKQVKNTNSFSNLSQTTTGESTKKTIEAEQIILYEPQQIKSSKVSFSLPYNVEIPAIITHLTNVFSEEIIHVEEDSQGGKILLRGIRNSARKRYLINFIDCLGLFCWKYGLNGGSLHQTYSVISISVRKQILNNRCVINIQQIPSNLDNKASFNSLIITKIREQLKKIDFTHDRPTQNTVMTRYLSFDSIFLQQIQIKQKIHNIFVYEKEKKWERFRRLFKKSQDTVRQKIQQFREKLHAKQDNTAKKNFNSPSSLMQTIITESENLYRTLLNYYEKQIQQVQDHEIFSSLLSSPVQRQFTLYSIQDLLSGQFMDLMLGCYEACTQQQSTLFNKNAKQINLKFTTQQCFDYLELRDKFRLTKFNQPYFPSIQLLKQVPNATCPRQLLLTVQKVFSSVKIDCLKASKGKAELSSMDDLLPVMIFVTAKAAVMNFPAFVKMVDDYVRLKGVFQLQERIITTLYVAVEDITKKWNS